jgi:ribosomal protein L33
MADLVQLLCTECKRKNYQTTKNKRTHTAKLEFNTGNAVPPRQDDAGCG